MSIAPQEHGLGPTTPKTGPLRRSAARLAWLVSLVPLGLLPASGCTPAYHPRIRLNETVVRPDTAVLLITVDGMAEPVMDDMLAAGELPHIASLIDNGVRARRAICALPSLTYPNLTTILTGCRPSRHGIMGNKWFDRYSLRHLDYTTIATYRRADDDILVPTVYEHLGDAFTVSIQCAVRRGAGRKIDNWASSGLRWFVAGYEATDQLIPLRFDRIAREADRRGCWPVLIHAYFPGVDEVGHRHGCDSVRYRSALGNIDRQIGLMHQALGQADMASRTCTILVTDHSHTPVPPDQWFDVAGWLGEQVGLRVQTTPVRGRRLADRERIYAEVDAVVIAGGDRIAHVHLRGPGGWDEAPTAAQINRLLGGSEADRKRRGGQRANELPHQPGIEVVAVRTKSASGRFVVELYSPHGDALIERRQTADGVRYQYVIADRDPLELDQNAPGEGWYDGATWRAATQDCPFPGAVTGLAELFDSRRAGDVVLFASDGWDFTPGNRGGHGGLHARDTRVPMIFSGPMIDRSAVIDLARLVDVTPTILGLLDRPVDSRAVDGTDWSAKLRRADVHPAEEGP
ncbi:MAG: hypothetical protein GY842_16695 [bacterium]|nr:hypothetical protein [bacterium]